MFLTTGTGGLLFSDAVKSQDEKESHRGLGAAFGRNRNLSSRQDAKNAKNRERMTEGRGRRVT
jgi:hypothetical protein